MTTYTIPAQNRGLLQHRIAQLNKRAAKLGVPAIGIHEITSWCPLGTDAEGFALRLVTYEFEVTGAAIGLPGWRFVGSIEHHAQGNILRAAPGQTIPAKYREVASQCDHCQTQRRRKNTFVVEHWGSGETKQIGRQCTRDFLGHIDPDRLASYMQRLHDLADEPHDNEQRHFERVYAPVDIVANALAAIRAQGGFRPASFEDSTAGTVRDAYATGKAAAERRRAIDWTPPTKAEHAEAVELVEWILGTDDQNDYMHNLRVAAGLDAATSKHIGLLASAPKAAQTAAERKLEADRRAAEKAEREANAQPAPEGRVEVTGEVVKITAQETDFGTVDKMIVAADGGFRVWLSIPAAIMEVEAGQRVTFTATLTRGRDNDFAFGKRPTKAAILETADA